MDTDVITVEGLWDPRIRGCTIIDSPPFFESVGSEKLAESVVMDRGQEGSSLTQGEGDRLLAVRRTGLSVELSR